MGRPPATAIGIAALVLVAATASACGSTSAGKAPCALPNNTVRAETRHVVGTPEIAYRVFGESPAAIHLVNPDGTGRRSLIQRPGLGFFGWSPDGSKLLFSVENKDLETVAVWVANSDGTAERKVIDDASRNGLVAWSPNGRKIAFERRRVIDAEGDIWLINADGSGLRRLTRTGDDDGEPTWSPDGRMLVFMRTTANGSDVWVSTADGSCKRNVSKRPPYDHDPMWSPDGTKIAYLRDRRQTELFVANPDGTERHKLGPKLPVLEFQWAPSGDQIAFVAGRAAQKRELYVVAPDGSGLRQLTHNQDEELFVQWSPDGRKVAFSAGEAYGRGYEIHTIGLEGEPEQRLTRSNQRWDYLSDWSPDGSMIGFSRGLFPGETADMWIINADGTGAHDVVPSLNYMHDVAWTWTPPL